MRRVLAASVFGAVQVIAKEMRWVFWGLNLGILIAVLALFVARGHLTPARAVGLSLIVCGLNLALAVLIRRPRPARTAPAWEPTLGNDTQRLGEVFDDMPTSPEGRLPWYVRAFTDPRSPMAVPGALDRVARRCLHIILGRGLTVPDQAFVAGFAIGASISDMPAWRLDLYRFCMLRLCPAPARWQAADRARFEAGLEVGRQTAHPVHRAPYLGLMERPLGEIRNALAIDTEVLSLRYDIERVRYR